MATKVILPLVPKGALNKNRAVSGLLKAQILHLHEAERRLPLRHHTDIYINAIKTEGEAAEYIRRVTEAIYSAHADAAARRARPKRKAIRGIDIAAVADEGARPKPKNGGKSKKNRKS
jgi:ArsR family metal-binding transcriptional regulator